MIGWLLRALTRLGLRWFLVGAVARYVARRFGRTSVERATDDLEALAVERLPTPLAKVVTALPVEAKRVGGSAVVVGRATRGAINTSRRAARLASSTSRRAVTGVGSFRAVVDEVKAETDAGARRFRARYLATTVGPDAATDALLDVRTEPPFSAVDDDPHDRVPQPVIAGRPRRIRRIAGPVNRVRRTYRPTPKPWE